MEYTQLLFYFLIFIVAFVYSSVGHGGASGYLALMALFAFDVSVMKVTALTMNLFVSGVAFFVGYRAGYFRLKLLVPLIIGSMPMAFLGAKLDIAQEAYLLFLGIFLLLAGLRIFFQPEVSFEYTNSVHWYTLVLIGMVLGFLSGMLGIGGGIILSPVLLLFRWAKLREVSVLAAAFIFLNSMSGLLGMYSKTLTHIDTLYILVLIGVAGAISGSYSAMKLFSGRTVKIILTIVLSSAGIKLIFF